MKASKIYLEAAKLIDRKFTMYSCNAIDVVEKPRDRRKGLSSGYGRLMGFNDEFDFYLAHGLAGPTNIAARKHRVLLLLLASAISKSEGL